SARSKMTSPTSSEAAGRQGEEVVMYAVDLSAHDGPRDAADCREEGFVSGLSVTVVIPAYKAARTINRAVESVLGQTRRPAEVLVVDDGSPDGADLAAAVARYGGRVTLLRKLNGGAASARNYG